MLHAVIMAGGAGTRFWPASRAKLPKQLLPLASDRTMIQSTVDRIRGLVPSNRILVVTNEALVEAIREQLPEIPSAAILGEPCKRDTAPCVGLAAGIVAQKDRTATMVVMPSDHIISPTEAFHTAIRTAEQLVDEDPTAIVTFGIRPTYPAETFGYIQRDGEQNERSTGVFRVKKFHEKPKLPVAKQYLEDGGYYWNSGIFVWRASTLWNALQKFEPAMVEHLSAIIAAYGSRAFSEVFPQRFTAIQGKSIDYAVMERHDNLWVVEAPFAWDDVGNWQSLTRLRGADQDKNTVIGRHVGLNTHGCIVRGDGEHLIVTIGLQDCIVVHTPDATLVARKDDEESIRQIVDLLKQRGWTEYL